MISCPREGGREGRLDGHRMYRAWRSPQGALQQAQTFPQLRGASEMTRRVYAYGYLEGFEAARQAEEARRGSR